MEYTADTLINEIKKHCLATEKALGADINTDTTAGASHIRTALETAVKLYYLKKYGNIPEYETSWFFSAINDERFSSAFSKFVINDIQTIRTACNKVIHAEETVSSEELREIYSRMKTCLYAIMEKISVRIATSLLKLHEGERFSTRAISHKEAREEIIKTIFNSQYDGQYSTWCLNKQYIVWIVAFDGKIRRGWRNEILSDEEVYQENTYRKRIRPRDLYHLRLTFEIKESNKSIALVFKGIYQYEQEKSDLNGKMYFRKVSSEYVLK